MGKGELLAAFDFTALTRKGLLDLSINANKKSEVQITLCLALTSYVLKKY